MNTLICLPTVGHIKTALRSLNKGLEGLDDTYRQAMKRIEDQGVESRDLAKRILAWIIYSRRQLSSRELQHALAVEVGTVALNEDFLLGINVLKSICAGLVTVDE